MQAQAIGLQNVSKIFVRPDFGEHPWNKFSRAQAIQLDIHVRVLFPESGIEQIDGFQTHGPINDHFAFFFCALDEFGGVFGLPPGRLESYEQKT
jgi:hypothetical protein